MIPLDSVIWLQERTALGSLSPEVLKAIALVLEEQVIPVNQQLVSEGATPKALYILKQGRLESYHTQQGKKEQASSLLPGAVVHLQELLLDQPAQQTITALSECRLAVVSAPNSGNSSLITRKSLKLSRGSWLKNSLRCLLS